MSGHPFDGHAATCALLYDGASGEALRCDCGGAKRPVTAPTDAVAQAREEVEAANALADAVMQFRRNSDKLTELGPFVARYRAAVEARVRAECADRVRLDLLKLHARPTSGGSRDGE